MKDRNEKKPDNIIKFRKPVNLNIGMMLFLAIIVYLIYAIVAHIGSRKVVRYEVSEGSLAVNTIYTGLILRDEQLVRTNDAGYVNYYTYEGDRVAVGDLVYTVDETGKMSEYLNSLETDYSDLSEKELRDFRNDIQNYQHSFSDKTFKSVYDFKHTLNQSVLKLANYNMLKNVALAGNQGSIKYNYAHISGIVGFWLDGYETLTQQDITNESFNRDDYEKKVILANSLVGHNDVVYKVSSNEHWSVVIQVDEARAQDLQEEGYVKVKFLKNQYESWAEVFIFRNEQDELFARLEFTNSMVTFASDRFLDVELMLHDQTGLKIPLTSIVEKEFFLVEEDMIFHNDSGETGVYRQCYLEDGTISAEFYPISVYSYDEDEKFYYVDADVLSAGDVLHKLDGQRTFTVSKRATLIGVYNMNKGYADFKEIQILFQNDEYAIVKANTVYGLNVYDYIALDAKSVKDDQFINQ